MSTGPRPPSTVSPFTPAALRLRLAALATVALTLLAAAGPAAADPQPGWTVTHETGLTPEGVAGYQALLGLTPAPGLPGTQGFGLFEVSTDTFVITSYLQYTTPQPLTAAKIVCRVQTPLGPQTITRTLPPGSDQAISDAWVATPAVAAAFDQGTCYAVFTATNYPKGAMAGQILPISPSGPGNL